MLLMPGNDSFEGSRLALCNGDCFDLRSLISSISTPHNTPPIKANDGPEQDGTEVTQIQTLYTPLQTCQTRLIRLAPFRSSASLEFDLVTADLVITPGLRLAGTSESVTYTAISYCWDPRIATTLVRCNGVPIALEQNVALALAQHQSTGKHVFIWLDALCIDQSNNREKAFQIVNIFEIYRKAESVTAWLGSHNSSSRLAVQCLKKGAAIKSAFYQAATTVHQRGCRTYVRQMHDAVLSLFERPFLSRTWIRQELFAAREIQFACGANRLSCDEFFAGDELLLASSRLAEPEPVVPESRLAIVSARLSEARLNSYSSRGLWPVPRDLFDVLEQSHNYKCSVEQDTVYAILGLCGVKTRSDSTDEQFTDDNFLIDYSRDLNRVFHDASIRLVETMNTPEQITRLWSYHDGSPQHNPGLPSWAIDWRHPTYSSEEIKAMDWIFKPTRWLDRIPPWRLPKISPIDDRCLELTARPLDYVAYVSDQSCDFDKFTRAIRERASNLKETLSSEWASWYTNRELFESITNERFHKEFHQAFEPFDPAKHKWRLAILGVSRIIALMSSSIKRGDLVVQVAKTMFPFVLSPIVNTSQHKLPTTHDPYEEYRELQATGRWHDRDYKALHVLAMHLSGAYATSIYEGQGDEKSRASLERSMAILDRMTRDHGCQYRFRGLVFARRYWNTPIDSFATKPRDFLRFDPDKPLRTFHVL